jgi:hypothetical protein
MIERKAEQVIDDQCSQCLRNKKRECLALKERQWPCWAYIDDKVEFNRRERERNNYSAIHSSTKAT